jgi:hypothetical protein
LFRVESASHLLRNLVDLCLQVGLLCISICLRSFLSGLLGLPVLFSLNLFSLFSLLFGLGFLPFSLKPGSGFRLGFLTESFFRLELGFGLFLSFLGEFLLVKLFFHLLIFLGQQGHLFCVLSLEFGVFFSFFTHFLFVDLCFKSHFGFSLGFDLSNTCSFNGSLLSRNFLFFLSLFSSRLFCLLLLFSFSFLSLLLLLEFNFQFLFESLLELGLLLLPLLFENGLLLHQFLVLLLLFGLLLAIHLNGGEDGFLGLFLS